jgi:hypothetical protein
MELDQRSLRMRVDSCQRVIQDVSQRLSQESVHPSIVDQLQRLTELLALIDHRLVNEKDLDRIEVSTNQLLHELGELFSNKGFGTLYDDPLQ